MSKIKFVYELEDGLGEYPNDVNFTLEFNGEASLNQVVGAFKMFLKGIEFSDKLVEGIYCEN